MKGKSRSSICDIQRNEIYLIPNALYDLIMQFAFYSFAQITLYYGEQNVCKVEEYINFLIKNDLAFYCEFDELNNFPEIDMSEFNYPSFFTNAIVELEEFNSTYIEHIIEELNSVHCPALEIRIIRTIELEEVKQIINLLNKKYVEIVDLSIIMPDNNFNLDLLKLLFPQNFRLAKIILCDSNKNMKYDDFFGNSMIIYTTRKAFLPTCCGNFSPELNIINLPFFTESLHYNNCLNRKVAIDRIGNIKNCPSLNNSYGNIVDVKLVDVYKNDKFTELWKINKNKIKICNECEFRYVCMDCRAYLEYSTDEYSKPLKCGYNPQTMEWSNWITDPDKKSSIENYKLVYL